MSGYALDANNQKLITADMKAKLDAAKADIIAGKIRGRVLVDPRR